MTKKERRNNTEFDTHQRIVSALITIENLIRSKEIDFTQLEGAKINLEKAEDSMKYLRGKEWTTQ
jgi:hypothetical protein